MDELENLRQSLTGLRNLRDRLKVQLDQVEENISSLEKLMDVLGAVVPLEKISLPDKVSWREKILLLLRSLGECSPDKVAKALSTYGRILKDEGYKQEHYLNVASQYLPNLFKEGLLERRKHGRSYVYKIKEKK